MSKPLEQLQTFLPLPDGTSRAGTPLLTQIAAKMLHSVLKLTQPKPTFNLWGGLTSTPSHHIPLPQGRELLTRSHKAGRLPGSSQRRKRGQGLKCTEAVR